VTTVKVQLLTPIDRTCDNSEGTADTASSREDSRKIAMAHNVDLECSKCKFCLKKH
jgi:hypothetical protein